MKTVACLRSTRNISSYWSVGSGGVDIWLTFDVALAAICAIGADFKEALSLRMQPAPFYMFLSEKSVSMPPKAYWETSTFLGPTGV